MKRWIPDQSLSIDYPVKQDEDGTYWLVLGENEYRLKATNDVELLKEIKEFDRRMLAEAVSE